MAERLDSWKEIAVYLGRDVRTVQRWERTEGLPVHRHSHGERATIYAYPAEIDAWLETRRVAAAAENGAGPLPGAVRPRWALWGIGLAAAACAIGALAWWAYRGRVERPKLAFQARDWVLITPCENRTGEPVFDGTVEYALERALIESRFVNVVSRDRVEDALRLMRRPADSRIDVALGREVCLRDGGIRALVAGKVEKLGSRYVLGLQLVEPATGLALAAATREAASQEKVVEAVHTLSNWVRDALGETLPRPSEPNLERVTTASLRALQLYSQADEYLLRGQSASTDQIAETMLREAIALDPGFASGHMMLAWALLRLQRPREDYLRHAERAVELSGGVGERERYFILGSYHGFFKDEPEKALPLIEALVRLYPDHPWGAFKAYVLCWSVGRREDAIRYGALYARGRPHDLRSNGLAAHLLAIRGRDFAAARPYLERASAVARASPEARAIQPFWATFIKMLPAHELWFGGDVSGFVREVDAIARTLEGRSGEEAAHLAVQLGQASMTAGKLEAARRLFQAVSGSGWVDPGSDLGWQQVSNLALVAFLQGDSGELGRQLDKLRPDPSRAESFALILMARAGLVSEKDLERLVHVPVTLCRGEIALRQGNATKAIPLLRKALGSRSAGGNTEDLFLGAESLADAYVRLGDPGQAASVLEDIAKQPFFQGGSALWIRCKLLLAGIYGRMGRIPDAENLHAELRKLLAHADPDHPILRRLQEARR